MDVHRDFLIACIAATNAQGVTEYQSRRFSTYTGSLRELRDWLLANDCKDVCMESTGKYWFPVHNILEESCHVVVSHPKFVKAIKGKKTDKKDAQWIADLFKHDLVRGSFIPPKDMILSRLVDTFISRISLTMLPVPNPHNTVCVLSWEEARHWQSRSSGYSSS